MAKTPINNIYSWVYCMKEVRLKIVHYLSKRRNTFLGWLLKEKQVLFSGFWHFQQGKLSYIEKNSRLWLFLAKLDY